MGHSPLLKTIPTWEGNEFFLERGMELVKKIWICLCQKCRKCVNSTEKKTQKNFIGRGKPLPDHHCEGETNFSWKWVEN